MNKYGLFQCLGYFCLFCSNVYSENIIIQNRNVNITDSKIKSEFLAQPIEVQNKLKSDEWGIRKFVDAIHNETLFEVEAEKMKLKDDPEVAEKISLAVRKALIDAMVEKKIKSVKVPNMEPLALAEYEAHPENYQENEKVNARHILVSIDEKNKAEKTKFLLSIKNRIEKGGDFAALAKQFSEDKGSAVKGGDLGVFGKGQMVKPFEDAVFALKKPKQLSNIVETKYGLHLVQLLERIPAKRKSFEEVKAELIAAQQQEYLKNEMKSWRDSIIDTSKAKLNEAELQKVIDEIKKMP